MLSCHASDSRYCRPSDRRNKRSRPTGIVCEALGSLGAALQRTSSLRNSRRREPPFARLTGKLYALLGQLPVEHRRVVISRRLTQHQRLALEHWILVQQVGQAQQKAPAAARATTSRMAVVSTIPVRSISTVRRISLVSGDHAHRDLKLVNGKKRPRIAPALGKLSIPGIVTNPQSNGCYYFVHLTVDNLRLVSRADRDIRVILAFHQALSAVRQEMIGCKEDHFEERFRTAVWATMQEHNLDASAAGLRFFVSMKPLWVASPLCTRAYALADAAEMDAGLWARRRLVQARGDVRRGSFVLWARSPADVNRDWQGFRAAYLEVMLKAGCEVEGVLARLGKVEAQQEARRERQLEAWNTARMAREERMQTMASKSKRSEALQKPDSSGSLKQSYPSGNTTENKVERVLRQWATLLRSHKSTRKMMAIGP